MHPFILYIKFLELTYVRFEPKIPMSMRIRATTIDKSTKFKAKNTFFSQHFFWEIVRMAYLGLPTLHFTQHSLTNKLILWNHMLILFDYFDSINEFGSGIYQEGFTVCVQCLKCVCFVNVKYYHNISLILYFNTNTNNFIQMRNYKAKNLENASRVYMKNVCYNLNRSQYIDLFIRRLIALRFVLYHLSSGIVTHFETKIYITYISLRNPVIS